MTQSHTFCFSMDVELGIGAEHSVVKRCSDPKHARRVMVDVLSGLRKTGIRATFALIGHLMLPGCQGHDPRRSPSIDWWKMDPCSSYPSEDSWYAPDIVRMIDSEGHEIACHTFSHVDFASPACTPNVARFEIEEWLKASGNMGISSRSFVFPRNNTGYLELLPEYGFDRYAVDGGSQDFFNPSLPSPYPSEVGGMLVIPRTFMISEFRLSNPQKAGKLSRLLMHWKKRGGFFHLWTHEWSLASRRDLMILGNALKFAGRHGEGIGFSDL